MNKKVLGIGEVVLDKVHQLSSFPSEGEKIVARAVDTMLGGPVPTALILLARLGMECMMACSIASDEGGKLITSILTKEEIHIVPQQMDSTQVHTVVVNSQTGSRTIIKDIVKRPPLKNISQEIVQSADALLCDRHEYLAVSHALSNKRSSTISIMDPSVDCSSETINLLGRVDFPIIPLETLHLLFPRLSLKEGTKKLSHQLGRPIVITMGEYGSAVWDKQNFIVHPSISVKVVDTLGAGDIYRGGFAYGLLKGWGIHQCAQFANSVAALQCTKQGNSTAIPTKEEIMSVQKLSVHLSNSISLL